MNTKLIIFLLGIISILTGCKRNEKTVISAVCQREEIGNYLIKWEINPKAKAPMKLYVSDDPDAFNLSKSVRYTQIDNGVAKYITKENISRKYFMLSFDNQYFKIIGARNIRTNRIQNLRDIGGYSNSNQQEIRWGKVFRSGDLSSISNNDLLRLKNLKIKTIIDFRPKEIVQKRPIPINFSRIINIPIPTINEKEIHEKLLKGIIKKGDGMLFLEDTYLRFISHYSVEFGKAFKLLTNKNNYPILVSSGLGKDKVGFFTAILMSILDMHKESIKKDFLLSNKYIKIDPFNYARKLNTDSQETITVLLGAHESCFNLVFKQIEKKYGSIDKYLKEGLKLSDEDLNMIREILLR